MEYLDPKLVMEAEANVAKISPEINKIFQLMTPEIQALPTKAPKEKLKVFYAIANQINDEVTPKTACKNGCNHCCHQAVGISTEEAKRISRAIGRPYLALTTHEPINVRTQQALAGVPCVFLEEGKCSIYEHRPMVCRTYFNVSDTVEICDTIKKPGAKVPNLNFNGFMKMFVEQMSDGHWYDIRQWFPNGRH